MSTTAPRWTRSSYSSAQGDDCVEVAPLPSAVRVRDSKRPAGPALTLSHTAWGPFIAQAGDFGADSPASGS
ncbi:DUF397 domain-containing protein [Streptomyces caniscabiei]|uniref:DUF397 domain-containing protein n=1 Tax=Streptomyces caniscabiei TaxID=2746961 RepID=A0A927QNK4_9ACTN|nr:DUF397 domain-containing protein [Streptomyces caniscabiei]MBD9728022.1 DUF397 domain-containing protein [Streptomyces caniscabiei]MDX3513964.1 DUF397 domain-containing protein [Streptomyces caniscabiei]MDX3722966.1 DUF397 domain-containing protein [Streptomyces caniscabiei]WEO23508.1 DUF397 domain-containing protein [Streptomyces caniscabiei]